MDKKQIISVMTKKGYHVSMEDRIPMFLLDPSLQTPAQLKKALVEVGYENSFGYKLVGKGSLEKLAVSEENPSKAEDFEEEDAEEIVLDTVTETFEAEVLKDDEEREMNVKQESTEETGLAVNDEPEFYDEDLPDDDGESSMWSDSDDFFESADGQMSFF